MTDNRAIVASVLMAFLLGAALAYLPKAVYLAGNFMPVYVSVSLTLLIGCFIGPLVAGTIIGRSHDEIRQLALIVLILGLPAVVIFSVLTSEIVLKSFFPFLFVVFLIMFAALLGYIIGRDDRLSR